MREPELNHGPATIGWAREIAAAIVAKAVGTCVVPLDEQTTSGSNNQ
jgi:hypothetical protein